MIRHRHKLEELRYYYDGSPYQVGSRVWNKKGNKFILCYCTICGKVFVKKDVTKRVKLKYE